MINESLAPHHRDREGSLVHSSLLRTTHLALGCGQSKPRATGLFEPAMVVRHLGDEGRRSNMRPSRQQAVIFVSFVLVGSYLASSFGHESAAERHVWKSYTNVRFQYAICYPEDLLVPQGESANSDGQKFLAKDGAQLLVFGQNNVLDESMKDALADTVSRLAGASGKTTYKTLKRNGFDVSGQKGQTVFYARTRYSDHQFKSFELTYNYSAAAVYEPLISRLTACFVDLGR
jgi:hypothetical protein